MVRRATVVTADLQTGQTWMSWLRAEGFSTTGCAGPARTYACPRVRGDRCEARECAAFVVVDLASDPGNVCSAGSRRTTMAVDGDDPAAIDRRAFVARIRSFG
jgi:hypothetical protein